MWYLIVSTPDLCTLTLFQTDEDVYFRAVYVPPVYIGYSQTDIMEHFYNELESFTWANKCVYLLGDLYAGTYALSDIKITDDEMLRHIGVI